MFCFLNVNMIVSFLHNCKIATVMLINLIVAFVPFLFLNFKAMQFLIILIRTLFILRILM